jgi:hypothetical protein
MLPPPARRVRRMLAAVSVSVALLGASAGCALSAANAGTSTGTWPGAGGRQPGEVAKVALASVAAPSGGAANPLPPTPGQVMLGEYVDLSGRGESQSLTLRRQELGRNPRILHRFYQWTDDLPRHPQQLPAGSTLLLSWAGTTYGSILNGSQDRLIARAADAMATYHDPLFIRWAWEMNGDWYLWGGARNGNDPAGFIAAWRHIHDIFVAHHATNVAWVWGPNWNSEPAVPWNDLAQYYPGDDYVDWVGVSGYMVEGESCDDLLGEVYTKFSTRKPIMIAETGALERDPATKAARIDELRTWIIRHHSIAALVWFDTDTDHGSGKNWRVDSSPATLDTYRRLGLDPYFGG